MDQQEFQRQNGIIEAEVPSVHTNIQRATSEKLRRDVEAFLAEGGQPEQIPEGVTGQTYHGYNREQLGQLITTEEAADMLGISVERFNEAKRYGQYQGVKMPSPLYNRNTCGPGWKLNDIVHIRTQLNHRAVRR